MPLQFPQRPDNHITQTASFKVFSSKIPDRWLIREVTERDYGIDCYLEFVTVDGQVTGQLVSIQLKGLSGIPWTESQPVHHTLTGIKLSTTNYWYAFLVPVFLMLADTEQNRVFFLPVKSYIKRHFHDYTRQSTFSYRFEPEAELAGSHGIRRFLELYFREAKREFLEENLVTFISNHNRYSEFIASGTDWDCFLGVDLPRFLEVSQMYNNVLSLCEYFGIQWDLLTLQEYQKKSQEKFGDIYDLYENEMDEILQKIEPKLKLVILATKSFMEQEREYWLTINRQLYNLISNVSEDGDVVWI